MAKVRRRSLEQQGPGVPAELSYVQALGLFSRNARLYLIYILFNGINFGVFNIAFNLYLNSLGYGNDFIGFINSLPAIVVVVLGIPIGVIADRIGYRPFLLGGGVLTVIASILPFSFGAAIAMVVFAILFGVSRQFVWVLGQPFLAAASTPRERTHLFSVNSAIMTVAIAVGLLIGGEVPEFAAAQLHTSPNSAEALHFAFLAMTVTAAVGVIPLLMMRFTAREKAVVQQEEATERRALTMIKQGFSGLGAIDRRIFAKLLIPETIIATGAGALVVFFQLYFKQRFNLDPGPTSYILAFSALITAGTQLSGPLLARRVGRVRALVIVELASIPFLLTLAFSHSLALAVAAYYLRDALMNSSWPLAQSFAMEQVRDNERATFASLNAMVGGTGRGGLGPLISGWLQSIGSYEFAFSFTAVTYVVAAVTYYLFWRNVDPRPGLVVGEGLVGGASRVARTPSQPPPVGEESALYQF
jgi:MFS family permease